MTILRDYKTLDGMHVTPEGCACTKSITIPLSAHVNIDHDESYSVVIDQAIAGAAHFFYMKNGSDTPLRVTRMRGFVSADVELYILRAVTGTATAPSALIPVNRNFGSGKTAGDSTFQQGAALALTGGTEIDRWTIDFSQLPTFDMIWRSELILPKNQTLVVAGSAAVTINMTVSIHYYD